MANFPSKDEHWIFNDADLTEEELEDKYGSDWMYYDFEDYESQEELK